MISDACFDFCAETENLRCPAREAVLAATDLAEAIEHYSNDPFDYGPDIEPLRAAVAAFLRSSQDQTALEALRFICEGYREFYDGYVQHQGTVG